MLTGCQQSARAMQVLTVTQWKPNTAEEQSNIQELSLRQANWERCLFKLPSSQTRNKHHGHGMPSPREKRMMKTGLLLRKFFCTDHCGCTSARGTMGNFQRKNITFTIKNLCYLNRKTCGQVHGRQETHLCSAYITLGVCSMSASGSGTQETDTH